MRVCLTVIRTVSLILTVDKPKARAKMMERFCELAKQLRTLHNYSGLRSVLTGITIARNDGDEVDELFRSRGRMHKQFLSWTTLLGSSKMHRTYRTALKHTEGPAIPDMFVPARNP